MQQKEVILEGTIKAFNEKGLKFTMDDVAKMADRLLVLNGGKAEMCAPPPEVFANAQRLRSIGLSVPQVTELFLRLRELGLPVDPSVYTVPQALKQLLSLKGGRADA